jgi:ribosomal protein S18 acetylase RimI-like enzyme
MVSVRQSSVTESAAHALLAEYFESRAATFPEVMGSYHTAFPLPEQFVPPSGLFLVVEDVDLAGEPADVGCGGIRNVTAADGDLVLFEIKHLWLQPHLRSRGFGRFLLTQLETRAVELGAQELVLDTNASLTAAGGLYQSSGYVEIAPYNDNPNATHWYAKRVVRQ